MISEIIQYLINNQEVLEKIQQGAASIVGVSKEEAQIILDVLNGTAKMLSGYWY